MVAATPNDEAHGLARADAAADLHRQIRKRLCDRAHRRAVDGLAREGAVQVHEVQAPRALLHPARCHSDRVIAEDGRIVHAALAQAHAGAVLEVDGGDDQHAHSRARPFQATKFASNCSPAV